MSSVWNLTRAIVSVGFFACIITSCAEFKRPEPNPYLSETQPPLKQEFRWSNGGRPKSIDPARALAAPETDIVRALFEGLTELDPLTLQASPGVAEKWTSSGDKRVWTFVLRKDAKWSNGKPLIAGDFVRSWQRLLELGDKTAHRNLLDNISRVSLPETLPEQAEPEDFEDPIDEIPSESGLTSGADPQTPTVDPSDSPNAEPVEKSPKLDVVARDDNTLIVKLIQPDKDFPNVVSHSIFRPVFEGATGITEPKLGSKLVSNGAFHFSKFDGDSIQLERSETYWNTQNVKLDRVVFVPASRPDEALQAYRNGEVDAVTNAEFAPLAQKLFSPYADFRRSVFAALNFYEINHTKPPFTDRRVREALSIAIERERLSDAELDGTTKPAFSFLPFMTASQAKLVQDKDRARELFEQAGFAGGYGFPVIRLVVNRNETQQRVAREVIRMWKDELNVDAQLIVKENREIADTRSKLDFDIIRRGMVCPVASEFVCIGAIDGSSLPQMPGSGAEDAPDSAAPLTERSSNNSNSVSGAGTEIMSPVSGPAPIHSERAALYEMRSIPLYFPMSFSLIKPYVLGFEMNSLDAQSLGGMSIDSDWQPRQSESER